MRMHSIARTPKILTFMPYTGNCRKQKHTQHAPSPRAECDYPCGWINKTKQQQQTVKHAKISPEMVSPRGIAGGAEEEEEKEIPAQL